MENTVFVYKITGIPTLEGPEDRSVIWIGNSHKKVKNSIEFMADKERLIDYPPTAGSNLIIEVEAKGVKSFTYGTLTTYERTEAKEIDGKIPIRLRYKLIDERASI